MNTTQLAAHLGLTKGRISQLVKNGTLSECYKGDGRARRFDIDKVQQALKVRLDPGQMLGNGAKTRKVLAALDDDDQDAAPEAEAQGNQPRRDGVLPPGDIGRYEMARTQKAEEEAKRLRRQNLLEEGTLVLADQVAAVTKRAMAQEIATFEEVLRRGARAVADQLGVDFKTARQILVTTWRDHRATRSAALQDEADAATPSTEEKAADF